MIEKTDFTIAFESLKSAVMESSFGSMLGMFGGEKALEPLQEPFTKKMKVAINEIVHTNTFQNTSHYTSLNQNIVCALLSSALKLKELNKIPQFFLSIIFITVTNNDQFANCLKYGQVRQIA